MEWECHQCGHRHPTLPAACERCGTAPEIVRNVWRCAHCGTEGIPGDQSRCPGCGVDRALGVETAVDANARVEGELGRKLAAGDWRYCGYCDVQVPPVDAQGNANEVCPSCKGPLTEATQRAAEQEVSADEAGQYAAEKAEALGGSPSSTPSPAPRRRRIWPWIVVPVVLLVGGGIAYFALRGPAHFTVVSRQWQRAIAVEKLGPVQEEAWASAVPAAATDRSCRPRVHHYNKIPAGTERVTERVAAGRKCVAYGYKKRGGVSVKKCKRWETQYEQRTRTKTRYKRVPVMRNKCRYTVEKWHPVRRLAASGDGSKAPRWPAADALREGERAGKREASYTLTLADDEGQQQRYTCTSEQQWAAFPEGSAVAAETSLGGKIESIARP